METRAVILILTKFLFFETRGFQQNWLKVITEEGSEFSVTSRQCFGGIWTPETIQGKCICVSGIWAISKEFCDTDFEILTGDQHCFPVNRPIRKFSYIGPYWNQPRWFGSYIFRKDMPYVARFNRENSEYFLNDEPQYLMRVNMSSTFMARYDGSQHGDPDEICNPGTCSSDRVPSSLSLSIEIFKLDGRNTFKLGPKNQCFGRKSMDTIVTLKPGQSWRPKGGEVRQSVSIYPNCRPSRLMSTTDISISTRKKHVLTSRRITKHPQIRKYFQPTKPHLKILDSNKPTRPHTTKPSSTPSTLKQTTRRTTKLTTIAPSSKTTPKYKILYWNPIERPPKPLIWKPVKPKPTNKPPANQNQNNVDYEDDDRDPYWEGNFPEPEKNRLILEQTLRMLRMHLDFLANPGSRAMWIDKEEFMYLRIAKNILLKTCPDIEVPKPLVNSIIRLFRYALYESMEEYPYTEFTDADETLRINASLMRCYESAHKMTFLYNSTACSLKQKEIVKVTHNNEEYNVTALDGYASGSNATNFDFMLENVWKIMVHAHYYCAKNFGMNPADLSSLMVKWEAFFSPMLKYRWANPEASRNLYGAIFPNFDLNIFDSGLNKCLATANSLSHYPVWIQRPILKINQRPKPAKRRGKRSKPIQGRSGGKQEVFPPDHWNNQGHCLQKFFDPVRKYGASAPQACLREYNGHHDL